MLGQIESTAEAVVIADFEAGLGTVSRLKADQLDLLLIVFEPTMKAIDIARRSLSMIQDKQLGRAMVIANRIASAEDRNTAEAAFAGDSLVCIPDDDEVRRAGLHGASAFDTAPDAPAVRAIRALADRVIAG